MLNYIERCDRYSGFLVWLVAVAILAVAVACRSAETMTAAQRVQEQWDAAMADGVVTGEELQEHGRLLGAYFASDQADQQRTDWATLGSQVLIALLTGGGAVVAAASHQRKVWGTPDNPKPVAPIPTKV